MDGFASRRPSRRSLLRAMAALAGTAALPPYARAAARGSDRNPPAGCGNGRTVAIIGAGVAGLTAGWRLAKLGFKVTIYEADSRYGGRSLTARPDDSNGQNGRYRNWWFSKYNPGRLFPAMYVSQYKEVGGVPQICRFADPAWTGGQPPVELFLNVGPGRIPSDHEALLALCSEIGVALEPYIFQSNYNLLRSRSFDNGRPIAYNQVNYSLRGQLAAKMAELERSNCGPNSEDLMGGMLKGFGDLADDCKFPSNADGSSRSTRVGYLDLPGGWNTPGKTNKIVPLDDILSSGFVGGGNPEFVPGSFLFNADNVVWQNSLTQPVGGMDRIWQRLLVQTIPSAAVERHGDRDPRWPAIAKRDDRYVGDLVVLNSQVTGVRSSDTGVEFMVGGERRRADFCISTMAPGLLAQVLPNDPYHQKLREALGKAGEMMVPAIKVGWQAKTRFWEKENRIYGGISWTDDIIGQIWYPSEDFNTSTGVLTGAYNRGPLATKFGDLSQERRIRAALDGGETLHARFETKVYADKGVTVAWQKMPFQEGGWSAALGTSQSEIYRTMVTPLGRLSVAGCTYSYLPGWQEGAVTSAYKAVETIAQCP